jgi:hypothetical protein
MFLTYSLSTSRGKVRFFLGDTVIDRGPRPDKRNFTDEEIDYLLTAAGSLTKAVAAGFEILASEWTSYNLSEREGDVDFDAKGLADVYAKRAREWQTKVDEADSGGGLGAGVVTLDFMQKEDAT